jgi:glycosyltransferase involved in cell wall biosynthesis
VSVRRPSLMLRGNFHRPSGFAWINRRLAPGLAARGFDVATIPLDGEPESAPPDALPDVYLFHGDPYDFRHAPGYVNACFLHWEYLQLPEAWVREIGRRFDLVVAPSRHSREVYARSGIDLPMPLCPPAVDPAEFHPDAPPWPAPTEKSFRFVHLGGAHRRRGTDVLLDAYAAEFSSADDVALILKAFHYEHHRAWLLEQLAALARPGAPEVVYVHETLPSAAPVFAAADVGVYPLRAECYGLPILECIASGRRVIVTEQTAADEHCTPENADFVRGETVPEGDRTGREPDVGHLRSLMRAAYERGKPDATTQRRVAASVADRTWDRSVGLLADALREHRPARPVRPARAADVSSDPTSDEALPLASAVARAASSRGGASAALLLGRAGSCLETFRDTAPETVTLLWEEGAPARLQRAVEDDERDRCGVPRLAVDPFAEWRRDAERRLAKHVVVCGRAALEGYDRARGSVLPLPPVWSATAPAAPAPPGGPVRFLFLSARPFRDGLRPLLEAWDAARPSDCELVCATDKSALASGHLLRLLVKSPSVVVRDMPRTARERDDLLAAANVLVHPTLADGAPWTALAAMARGRAAILSAHASIARDVEHPVDGFVVEEVTPLALADAIGRMCDRERSAEMGAAALETVRRWSVAACAERLAECLEGPV